MKINGKEVVGEKFAYDGCHKIYIVEDEEDREKFVSYGYKIYDIKYIEDIYESSCSLRFINNCKLDKTYAAQFENATFEN